MYSVIAMWCGELTAVSDSNYANATTIGSSRRWYNRL